MLLHLAKLILVLSALGGCPEVNSKAGKGTNILSAKSFTLCTIKGGNRESDMFAIMSTKPK